MAVRTKIRKGNTNWYQGLFLTNGRVSWRLDKRIGRYYEDGYYQVPAGWSLVTALSQFVWAPGDCGELRRKGRGN
jgi:hypothetical protein